MAYRLQRLKAMSRFLPRVYSGIHLQQSGRPFSLNSSLLNLPLHACENTSKRFEQKVCDSKRFSTVLQISNGSPPVADVLSFIASTFNEPEGPDHYWLNKVALTKDFTERDGVFLVVAGAFLEDSANMFEKVKSLQQRYPSLPAMGFQFGSSLCSAANHTRLVQLIMTEYITFPLLLTNKDFTEMKNGAWYILFRGFSNPFVYNENNADLGTLSKAIKELHLAQNDTSGLVPNLKSSWMKQVEVIKEPDVCSSFRNLLLYFPGCISVDESGDRLFLSDSNHHRIMILDGGGKILDCIGSSPGFEDGVFESAKLMRPLASVYHAADNCLYFVDSENHAIRRAVLEKRMVETVYPTCTKKSSSLWTWILDKLGIERDFDMKLEETESSLVLPWHLIKSEDDNLYIINRSFEILWVLELPSGTMQEVFEGSSKIMEICGQIIVDKVSILRRMPSDWLQHQFDTNCSLKEIPCAGLLSSLASFQDHVIICDTVGQRILKLNKNSGLVSNFQLSNFGILGLPYWLSSSLERVYSSGEEICGADIHFESFTLLPGKIDIDLNVDIPKNAELLEPLQEGCVWCQVRGAAVEVPGTDKIEASTEKVGSAQQWYDNLDTLVFSTPEEECVEEENTISDCKLPEGRVQINCVVNTSPGTSEVFIDAALYLKLKRDSNLHDSQEKMAETMVDFLKPERHGRMRRGTCIQYLLKVKRDLEDLIFITPLRVRIKLDILNHPKADNSKDFVLTDSEIKVNISL